MIRALLWLAGSLLLLNSFFLFFEQLIEFANELQEPIVVLLHRNLLTQFQPTFFCFVLHGAQPKGRRGGVGGLYLPVKIKINLRSKSARNACGSWL
jgi:hypothetical protein